MTKTSKYLLLVLFTCLSQYLSSQQLKIGLFADQKINQFQITIQKGEYSLIIDSVLIDTLVSETNITITKTENTICFILDDTTLLSSVNVELVSNTNSSFFINHNESKTKARCYEGDLQVFIANSKLIIVNIIDTETYVAAVVEAEAGYKQALEYYKTQAVICRTYAISHINRHKEDGFDLCDNVHCQVYSYKSMSKEIRDATISTSGYILVDSTYTPILAAYHSNSGGNTANSEDVWVSSLSYLKSVNDSVSLEGKKAFWHKEIPLKEWKAFLEQYGVSQDLNDSIYMLPKALRQKEVKIAGTGIPLKLFRKHFHLRSAYFSTTLEGNIVVVNGRGYGHGVGLSQEGAMKLADIGWTFEEILKYYYSGVYVVKLQTVNALRKTGF